MYTLSTTKEGSSHVFCNKLSVSYKSRRECYFPFCLIDGTLFEPSWRINGTDYTPSLVPMQYQTGGQRITIKNVTWTENGLTFQYFIIVRGGRTLESTVGRIISKLHLNLCWMLEGFNLDSIN